MPEREVVDIDPKKDILRIEPVTEFALAPTERLTQNFLVSGDYLFVSNYYGPIEVYSLQWQKKVFTLHFNYSMNKELASDGKHLYVGLPSEGFRPKDNDILLLREKEVKAPGKLEDEIETVEFVGKTFRELGIPIEFDQQYSAKFKGVILSLPLIEFWRDSIVWSPATLAEETGRKFYIADMHHGIDHGLRSGKDFAKVTWKTNLYHDMGWSSILLREGKILTEPVAIGSDPQDAFSKLWISSGQYNKGLIGRILHWDESYGSREPDYVSIPLVLPYVASNLNLGSQEVLGVQQERDLLYVLTNSSSATNHGVTKIHSPHRLLTYKLSFQRPTEIKV